MARRTQQGNTILAVSAIGAAATFIMTAVMNSTVVAEERAIDAHLTEIRAYWGAMGHFHYAMSRIRHSELCGQYWGCNGSSDGTDSEKAATLQAYLDEVEALRELTYREESEDYRITLDLTAAPDDTPGRHSYSGHVMMRSAVIVDEDEDTVPVLADIAPTLPGYEMRLCVGLQNHNADCGAIDQANGGRFTDHFNVKRFTRLAGN